MEYFTILVLFLILAILRKSRKEKEQLMVRAQRDSLTGLYNKETTQNLISEIVSDGKIHGFMILDIDFFKSVNDTYGHAVGDKVLSAVGNLFQMQFRNQDIIGRIGGDEFIAVLWNADRAAVESCLARIRTNVNEYSVAHPDMPISYAVGYALSSDFDEPPTMRELFSQADKNMYIDKNRAKADGAAELRCEDR